MRGNGARRALIAALVVFLALLVVNFGRRSVEIEMYRENLYPRQNPTLSLEMGRDGIIRVEGEGVLYGTDMNSMLDESGIHSKRVNHIIIGDGITEIQYEALSDRKYLLTLKIGRNVRRISAGAVKNCTALQCIYLPSGLQNVLGDFLYNCNDCMVITDGAADELPEKMNLTENMTVLEHVDSYEALLDACEDTNMLPSTLKQWWA